jgi:HSP20 family protein
MTNESRDRTSVEEFLADVEAYFDGWFRAKLPFAIHGGMRWSPPTDVFETDGEIRITMAVPGIRIEDIVIQFENGTLTVRGVRREPCADRRRYHTMEIPVGPFGRRVRVLRPVAEEEIKVTYADGLLRISLPKSPSERRDGSID